MGRAMAAILVAAVTLGLNPSDAAADPLGLAGSVSVQIPETPGDMDLTLTVNGQMYVFDDVDDSLGGTITLGWVASEEQPQTTIESCEGAAPGAEIVLEEATPSAIIWATWISPASQVLLGPVEVTSREGLATAGACVSDGPYENPAPGSSGQAHGHGQEDGNGHGNGNANGHGNGANGNAYGQGNGHGHSYGRLQ